MTDIKYSADDLARCVEQLGPKDQAFAYSLITKARRWGASEKQSLWIDKLTKQAKGEIVQAPRATVQVGDLTQAIALFDKARETLKFPKIVLRVDGVDIKLSVAGERAKVPGSINIASGRYGEGGGWYGRITRDGQWQPARDAASVPNLGEYLARFAAEPAKVAAEYGKLTGNCCFCSKALSDARSTAVGYGSTCARNYGLPWGTAA